MGRIKCQIVSPRRTKNETFCKLPEFKPPISNQPRSTAKIFIKILPRKNDGNAISVMHSTVVA